ncbi:MAG TPA: NAD(P)H-binding protein, partial [Acidothermaceae bacterium]|nr:NAD(P)H-binding protein [Acidothermaceae bacterium]
MRVAVVGANGFVGRKLTVALVEAQYDVIAISRRAPEISGATGRAVDVADGAAVTIALDGCEVAFYLVHSLSDEDFRARDRQLAEGFGRAAVAAGLRRIVYLGGLGHEPESEHLASRQEVGTALASAGMPVVELRAAVVLGAGSISFEMLRYLTERLPFMVCPRWVRTAIQPIASADMTRYLIGAIHVAPGVYEVGGGDVTSYREMITAYAAARGLRRRRIVDVPLLTPRLSSYWLDLVTPVDRRVSHALIESLVTEVVVVDRERTDAAFNIEPMGLVAALTAALDDQALELDHDLLSRDGGLRDGVYTVRVTVPLSGSDSTRLDADLGRIGGSYSWYGLTF